MARRDTCSWVSEISGARTRCACIASMKPPAVDPFSSRRPPLERRAVFPGFLRRDARPIRLMRKWPLRFAGRKDRSYPVERSDSGLGAPDTQSGDEHPHGATPNRSAAVSRSRTGVRLALHRVAWWNRGAIEKSTVSQRLGKHETERCRRIALAVMPSQTRDDREDDRHALR